ncbi:MAG: S-adenosyl-l-methionine hydroxide adenosyltransferase family protein [Pyrinomonadaceae bacterium]
MNIALLTDFGTMDYFVGAVKGTILSINSNATIIDITHEVPRHNVDAAAFLLAACYLDFPVGTIFLAVVDPGVGTNRRGLVVWSRERFFVGPDNGLFSFLLDNEADVFEISNDSYFRKAVSNTFQGRDIFAPAAAHISAGAEISNFGRRISDPVILDSIAVVRDGDLIEARIIYIDHFGNLITNLSPADLPSKFILRIGEHAITKVRENYDESSADEPFFIVGSTGFMEISVRQYSATRMLNASVGQKLEISAVEYA